jgi:hypothetical protein
MRTDRYKMILLPPNITKRVSINRVPFLIFVVSNASECQSNAFMHDLGHALLTWGQYPMRLAIVDATRGNHPSS